MKTITGVLPRRSRRSRLFSKYSVERGSRAGVVVA